MKRSYIKRKYLEEICDNYNCMIQMQYYFEQTDIRAVKRWTVNDKLSRNFTQLGALRIISQSVGVPIKELTEER